MSVVVKRIEGGFVPTGETRRTWRCKVCGRTGGTASWKGPNGETGATYCGWRPGDCPGTMETIEVPAERWVPGYVVVRCDCGGKVTCSGFTSTCGVCGADYNWNGSRLAPRSLWDGTDGAGSPGYE